MKIGIIGGSGFYAFPEMHSVRERQIHTEFGQIAVTEGTWGPATLYHLCRHGKGHSILSHQVNHRGNIKALQSLGVQAIIGTSVVGVLQPSLELGKLLIFNDLFFPENRLPSGEPCTIFTAPGHKGQGHLIWSGPFPMSLRAQVLEAVKRLGYDCDDAAVYGHVNGPRFNTRSEIGMLARAGVSAISQTAGPEVVLCAELEIPYQLIGFGIDYANGVKSDPTPVELLNSHMRKSVSQFKDVICETVKQLRPVQFDQGLMYRF